MTTSALVASLRESKIQSSRVLFNRQAALSILNSDNQSANVLKADKLVVRQESIFILN